MSSRYLYHKYSIGWFFFFLLITKIIAISSSRSNLSTSLLSKRNLSSMIRITSYNVLSSHLAAPSHFKACKEENLNAENRLVKIRSKLDQEIAKDSILCLQELSMPWTGKLHPYFLNQDYHLITALYGKKFNGYMGVGIAFPKSKYNLIDVEITRISDTKRMPWKPKRSFVEQIVSNISQYFLKWAQYFRLYTPPIDLWDSALYRFNQMIVMRLQCKETKETFVVGTYHMPCMFQLPAVMNVHCALSAQYIQQWAKEDPYIYTGDFNIKPGTSQYRLLTEGGLSDKDPDYPHPVEGDNWKPTLQHPLKSAYLTALGKEPDFTNYAKVKDEPEFIDTLDYIFYSDRLAVKEVDALPHRNDVVGPFPNDNEPSDHIAISASFTIEPKLALEQPPITLDGQTV